MLTVNLLDGRSMYAEIFVAQRTYLSLIEGVPSNSLNERIIQEDIPKLCTDVLHIENYVIIPPVYSNRSFNRRTWRALPPVVIAALFRCFAPVRDPEQAYSALGVAWLQESVDPPISLAALCGLKKLNWNKFACDFTD